WGWTGIPLMAPVVAESTYGSFSVQRPCTSCTHHVSTKVVDSTRTTDPTNNVQNPSEEVGWPKPILVSTSLSPLEQAPVSQVNVGAPSGMAVVNSAVAGGNGSKTRVVMFTSSKFFATVDEAKAWVGSAEHAQVEKMIASIRVD
ncbi:hypothetical protein, partial [Arthrobacter sp.]|uniref:hypothetical protein n=1 Tax=Arthrobacter sp. TaxID=1667 RepID=UPI00339275F5